MNAADGRKTIAERWQEPYRINRSMARCFRNDEDTVAIAKRTMQLIVELSASEERERKLRRALTKAQTMLLQAKDVPYNWTGWVEIAEALAPEGGTNG